MVDEEEEEQTVKGDLAGWVQKLYDSGEHSDCIVRCNESDFKVHEAVISACPFFAAALKVDFREKEDRIINLPDDDETAVENLLKHLYGYRLPDISYNNDPDEFLEYCNVFAIAVKYDVGSLQYMACSRAEDMINVYKLPEDTPQDNFFEGLLQLYRHESQSEHTYDLPRYLEQFFRRERARLLEEPHRSKLREVVRQYPDVALDLLQDLTHNCCRAH